jgi:hypothetical protein
MQFDDKAKKAVDAAQKGYDKAEAEVDGFFVRNKYTVLILTGVALALVAFAVTSLL